MDIKKIAELKAKSGLGLLDCKAALVAASGNMTLAETNLRKAGRSKMDGRVNHKVSEGRVSVICHGSKGVIVEINTETDFMANSDEFGGIVRAVGEMALDQSPGEVINTHEMRSCIENIRILANENIQFRQGFVFHKPFDTYIHHNKKLGVVVQFDRELPSEVSHKICLHVASVHPIPLGIADISKEILDKELEIAKAQVLNKPDHVIDKIVYGKIQKFLSTVVLLEQTLVMDTSLQVKDILPEGVNITNFIKYQVGD